jgi:predicted DNA-binding transcriptional regulator AlpA
MNPRSARLPHPAARSPVADTSTPNPDRLWSLADVSTYLHVSRRAVERLKSGGRLPRPIVVVGRLPRWRPEDVRQWAEEGGGHCE